jgi:SpoVK/Ycf46/Vps4 family AAA+-type ATPase
VILWIDELEKAFAQGGDDADGGVSRRVFGSFLGWLQERRGDVFVVATSNDVSRLPPEFIRRGRFDEVFFVDLPKPPIREGIFDIHLARRKQQSKQFDLAKLAAASEGFSGAEIEESVVAGLFSAFSANSALTTEILLQEIKNTRPLALTMTEKIGELRAWAVDRTVMADA